MKLLLMWSVIICSTTALQVAGNAAIKMAVTKVSHNSGIGTTLLPTSMFWDFTANTFEDNTEGPLKIPAKLVSKLPTTNAISGGNILVIEGKIKDGQEHIWPKFESEYDVLEDLVISENSQWVISQGIRVNMANDKVIRLVNGARVIALGEQGIPVKIEGITKVKGSWRGIYMDNSGQEANQIMFAEVPHAGSATMAGKEAASIQLGRKGKLFMSNSLLDLGKGQRIGSHIRRK